MYYYEISRFSCKFIFFLYIISFLWYTIFVRINPMGDIIRRLYKMIKHLKIKRSNLPFERRVAVFRRFGVICKATEDSNWELLLPAGVVIVENDDKKFWVFDTRNSSLVGVVENYTEPEGGILTLLWVFPRRAGLL